jgi:outer membrane protein TolC
MRLSNSFLYILLCLPALTRSQSAQEVLTAEKVMGMVRKNHPVAKQAALQIEKAAADLLSAKGGFDPVFDMDAGRKTFDGKNYYYHTHPELQFPTAAAVTIKTGLENNGGDNLFSENTKGRSSYIGIELPLGNGLLIDKRRAALQQAKILRNQSEQEKRKTLNNLLLDAYSAYWQWAGAYQLYQIYAGFVDNAANRLRLVKNAWTNGDRSVMDTVETFTQLQQYGLQQSEAQLKLNNACLELSNYLWLPGDSAYLLPTNAIPDTTGFTSIIDIPVLEELITQSLLQNPTLQSAALKINNMETERRLKFQELLPYVSIKANILNKDYQLFKNWDAGFIENNYKWGVSFHMPLLRRQGRGEYKKAQLKVKESQIELAGKRWQTETKIRYYYNEHTQLLQQLKLTKQIQANYLLLLRNEELKFAQGESNLFMINTRENKLLELLEKQVSLRVKHLIVNYKLTWAAGLLQ